MPKSQGDIDLANGRFRLDLKTGLLLLALAGSWYDARQQQQQQAIQETADRKMQAALDAQQGKQVADALGEVKRLQMAQAYDVRQIIVALAERGIVIKETK